jgi:hypothetical protein
MAILEAVLSTITAISRDNHADKGWRPYEGYAFAAKTILAPLAAAEITQAALALPLAFFKSGETVSLMAVLGLHPGQNLFVAPAGKWAGSYVPSSLRSYPFILGRDGQDQLTLCFDESSDLLCGRHEGKAFFEEDGSPSTAVQKVLGFLTQVSRGQQAVASAAQALLSAGVLEDWPLRVKDEEQERDVRGLLRVSEKALNNLAVEPFMALRTSGALPLAYAQLLSMQNIGLLSRLAQLHADFQRREQQAEAEQRAMFEPHDDMEDKIDWETLLK